MIFYLDNHLALDYVEINALTNDELNEISSICESLPLEKAMIGNTQTIELNLKSRDSLVGWLNIDENSSWVYDIFSNLTKQINNQYFKFDLTFIDELQYIVYNKNRQVITQMTNFFNQYNLININVFFFLHRNLKMLRGELRLKHYEQLVWKLRSGFLTKMRLATLGTA